MLLPCLCLLLPRAYVVRQFWKLILYVYLALPLRQQQPASLITCYLLPVQIDHKHYTTLDTIITGSYSVYVPKHMPFFRLIDVLKKPGTQKKQLPPKMHPCPVCSLLLTDQEHFFETLLYEGVNDRGFRKKFKQAGGFCSFHSYELKEKKDGLAVAVMYRSLLLKQFTREITPRPEHCPACVYLADKEKHYRSVLLEYMNDPQFIEAFQESPGLCLPHYHGLKAGGTDIPRWFMDFHAAAYKALEKEVLTYIDGCNQSLGDNRPELSRKTELIYQDVIRMLNAYPGRTEAAAAQWNGTEVSKKLFTSTLF